MKYVLLIADGMNDRPLEELEGKTPLEAAKTPYMDEIAFNGVVGLVKTIPPNTKPGSDIATLSILGYEPRKYYTGRGPLEAANLGIDLKDNEIAFRCNFITVFENRVVDYSAGHITTKEAKVLIDTLNRKLSSSKYKFYSGVSYRNLMIANGFGDETECVPPHDVVGQNIEENFPKGKDGEILIDIMQKSRKILEEHDVNKVRVDLKENPANMIWLWGGGRKPSLPSFEEKYGVKGFVISAVDLINGLGKILGLHVVKVPHVTGYYDTNYEGKAKYAIKNLKNYDFGFVHLEATDEAGHNADIREKVQAIERFDRFIVGPIYEFLKKEGDYRIIVSSDHATPISVRTHTTEPVAFTYCGKGVIPEISVESFNEKTASSTLVYIEQGNKLLERFIKE
jgi:2,3-bisphosphoglycerate-independent phosphoglycerate mutase